MEAIFQKARDGPQYMINKVEDLEMQEEQRVQREEEKKIQGMFPYLLYYSLLLGKEGFAMRKRRVSSCNQYKSRIWGENVVQIVGYIIKTPYLCVR